MLVYHFKYKITQIFEKNNELAHVRRAKKKKYLPPGLLTPVLLHDRTSLGEWHPLADMIMMGCSRPWDSTMLLACSSATHFQALACANISNSSKMRWCTNARFMVEEGSRQFLRYLPLTPNGIIGLVSLRQEPAGGWSKSVQVRWGMLWLRCGLQLVANISLSIR